MARRMESNKNKKEEKRKRHHTHTLAVTHAAFEMKTKHKTQ